MPGPPAFNPDDFNPDGSPAAPRATSTTTKPKTKEEALAAIDRQLGVRNQETKKQVGKAVSSSATDAGRLGATLRHGDPSFDPLSILSIVPAGIATLLTANQPDYQVGQIGGESRPLSEIPIIDRLVGKDQLNLADPLKAVITSPAEQKLYLKGEAPGYVNWGMGLLEGVGIIGDVVTDPLNAIGGIGMTDDAFKALDDVGRLDKTLAKLTEEAATATPESVVSRAKAAVEGVPHRSR